MSARPSSQSSSGTSQTPQTSQTPRSAASRLFDIRLLIGGLFVVYGAMLTVAGFFTSSAERAKAAGININLWLGISMLVVGVVFLVWMRTKPLVVEPNPTDGSGAKTVQDDRSRR